MVPAAFLDGYNGSGCACLGDLPFLAVGSTGLTYTRNTVPIYYLPLVYRFLGGYRCRAIPLSAFRDPQSRGFAALF